MRQVIFKLYSCESNGIVGGNNQASQYYFNQRHHAFLGNREHTAKANVTVVMIECRFGSVAVGGTGVTVIVIP